MLFDRILKVDQGKSAIFYQGKHISYGQLLLEVKQRAEYFQTHKGDYLLAHTSELDNLFNFLALIYTGQKGVFSGKNISSELKIAYAERYNLKIIDFSPISENTHLEAVNINPSDYFLGVLTSGSTGTSKVIWKDYQAWFSAFEHQSEIFGINGEDKVFVVDALGYSANLNTVIHALWLGATLVFSSLQEAKNWPSLIKSQEVTSLFLVPSHYRLLPDNAHFSNVKSLVSAGEKLDAKLAEKLLSIFPQAKLTEYYGAAELGHISYIQNQEIINNPTSVGKAFPGVNITIKDEKIWVNSPYVSPEYRNNNNTVFDIGYLDADGFLTLLGREGRMFNRRGLNIFAEEIENVAKLHPAIHDAVLVQSKSNSQHLELLLVKAKPIDQGELRDFLLKKVAKEKIPNRILFTEDIPRNDSGKVDFKVLAKRPVSEDSSINL